MKQRCILLYAMPYSIPDESTGVMNEGISLHYLLTDSLVPVEDRSRGTKGINPCKQSVDLAISSQLSKLPGLYDVEFALCQVRGKPTLTPVSFEFVSEIVTGGGGKGGANNHS